MTRRSTSAGPRFAVRTLGELGDGLVFAPERHLVASLASRAVDGVPLGEFVVERRERIDQAGSPRAIVCDTTHARDGVLDLAGALRDGAGSKSTKKFAAPGDILVSRLRPYLRQVAFVHSEAFRTALGGDDEGDVESPRPLAMSTEFYVLAPARSGEDIAFLLPWLLSADTQAALADAQEGGHHPRVPRESLFALRLPRALVRRRARTSIEVREALGEVYRAAARLRRALG